MEDLQLAIVFISEGKSNSEAFENKERGPYGPVLLEFGNLLSQRSGKVASVVVVLL